LEEVPEDWEKANVIPVFMKSKERLQPRHLHLIPGKVMEQIILEDTLKHMKEKNVIGISQHGFIKESNA